MLILADALVQAPDRVLRPGRLRVSGRQILEVGTDLRPIPGEDVRELPGITLAPGFINLHAHLELAPLHSTIPAGLPFAAWLRQLLPLLPGLHATARTTAILESSRRAAETGTTTILNIVSDSNALAGVTGTLPRIYWALEFMDLHGDPEPAKRIERLVAWISRHPGCDWHAALSPHAPFTASAGLYRECARLASELRLPLTTHLAESDEEESLFSSAQGALCALLPEPWSSGDRAERMATLPSGSLLAHGNRLAEPDLASLAARGCYVIHCPMTHRWFGRESFPWERFRHHHLPVLLGTDSPASSDNPCFDLRMEARAFRQAQPAVTAAELWSMLTTLPALALGQEGKLGCLEPGAEADWVGWKLGSCADPVSTLLDGTELAEVISVAGRLHRPEKI